MAHNYIITTDDYSSAMKKIDEIKNSFNEEFEYTTYDLEEDGIYSLIDDLTTISLFDNPKFIVVKQAHALLTMSDKAINELVSIMNDVNSQNVLIYLFTGSFDGNNDKYQKIKRFSIYINVNIKNMPFDKYIEKTLNENGYKMDSKAMSLLASYATSFSMLIQSLDVLMLYKSNNKIITDNDVRLMIAAPLDDNVYQLVEAVLNKDKKRMFSCYNDLKLNSVQPSFLVSLLINKFQELYNVYILYKSNVSQADIATTFNVSPGRAYYMLKNAKAYSLDIIKENLEYLNQLDLEIKSGKIDQSLGLELYFLR